MLGNGHSDNGTPPSPRGMGQLYLELGEMSARGDVTLGVSTGFPRIDEHLLGLRPGQMVVIGARPGVGKTSFALNLAVNAAAAGASVAFFSLEMSKVEIAQRLLAAQAHIGLKEIRSARIRKDQWGDILEATNQLSSLDIMIDDTPGTTVTEIRAKARRMLHDKGMGCVIVDYLQLLSPPEGQRRSDSRATEVSEMSRGIKIMSRDEGPLCYVEVDTGAGRAISQLEKHLDTNEFESRCLCVRRANPCVAVYAGVGAVGIAVVPQALLDGVVIGARKGLALDGMTG